MLNKVTSWIKNNKLASVLLLIVGLYLVRGFLSITHGIGGSLSSVPRQYRDSYSSNEMAYDYDYAGEEMLAPMAETKSMAPSLGGRAVAPQTNVTDRKVKTESYFSLVVDDVTGAVDVVKQKVQDLGGYMVTMRVQRPEGGDVGGDYATLTMRVPVDEMDTLQQFLRNKATKVVDENISGTDVTDQYVDIQERLLKLENVKTRFEEIMREAKDVDEILRVQNYIFNIQDQIDSYKGQLKYLDGTTTTTLISIYLSTDEIALPYMPAKAWRPQIIFKYAVRSMLGTLQSLGSAGIWLGVYSVIIVPVVIIIVLIRKRIRKNRQTMQL